MVLPVILVAIERRLDVSNHLSTIAIGNRPLRQASSCRLRAMAASMIWPVP
jgi:hypothetical protein